jgi:NAD(P)-dependent dehydrogenase (short-subunit alcohol dehydrogenase family)
VVPVKGKTAVVTGGTSGIGQIAAEVLAGMGARIVLIARDRTRGEAAMARLREKGPGLNHTIHYADLSVVAEMKRVGQEIADSEPRIDVLINNAGALYGRRQETKDGLERTFATNHVSYFVLTHLLRNRLLAASQARVVNTSSHAHRGAQLDFDDLQLESGYTGFKAYGRSKLCNILFTRELARRLEGTGVTANSLHPGFVNTRFGEAGNSGLGFGVFRFLKRFALTPEKGAETLIYLASSNEPSKESGAYFYKCRVTTPSLEAQNDEAARRLWLETARLAELEAGLLFSKTVPQAQ